jgi:hypothetical protein
MQTGVIRYPNDVQTGVMRYSVLCLCGYLRCCCARLEHDGVIKQLLRWMVALVNNNDICQFLSFFS